MDTVKSEIFQTKNIYFPHHDEKYIFLETGQKQ